MKTAALISQDLTGMRQSNSRIWRFYFCGVAGGNAVLPLVATFYGIDYLQATLAVLLLSICFYPTARYFAYQEAGIPALAILSLAYGLQFAVPIFTREPVIVLADAIEFELNSSDIVAALLMAILGVVVLQIAYYSFHSNSLMQFVPVARLHLAKTKAFYYCLIHSILLPLSINIKSVIPDQMQTPLGPVIILLQNQALVAIGILGWLIYSNRISKWYLGWLYALVAFSSMRGISEGWLEQAVVPIAVLFVVKWLNTRKIPVMSISSALLLVLFLAPAKGAFRDHVWYDVEGGATALSSVQKISFWVKEATEYWQDTLSGNHDFSESTAGVTGRTDLVHQLTHIYSMTPSTIPYQYGATYSYFAVALIPRVIWPDKPVAGTANSFFAVTYGITTEEGAERSTFGVSLLGEGYLNFGWVGVILIMAIQGIVIGLLQHSFGGVRSGAGGQAVFLAFFIFFLNGIGSSAEILFGNILQNLLCGCLLLWWARSSQPAEGKTLPIGISQPVFDR
jgi:hypothetical protein